jgi:hypothetical protein
MIGRFARWVTGEASRAIAVLIVGMVFNTLAVAASGQDILRRSLGRWYTT